MKNSNDSIGNRTRDLLACSAVSQPTAPPRAPVLKSNDVLITLEVLDERFSSFVLIINLSKPAGHVMHHQFNIQQLYALPTLYLCVLYLSENKQRLVPLTA